MGAGRTMGLDAHLAHLEDLQVFPTAAARVLEVVRSDKSNLADLERVVSADPVLAGRVMRIANSAMYTRYSRFDSVGRAVQALGFTETRDLAMALAISGVGTGRSGWGIRAWVHAMATAWASRSLARNVRQVDADAAFALGLLHEVGIQLLVMIHPEEAAQLLQAYGGIDAVPVEEERRLFGTDHAELGAAALRSWSIPEALCDAVSYHHSDPTQAITARPRNVALLQVADVLAGEVGRHRDARRAVKVAMAHPAAQYLRAVRGAYYAAADLLADNWDEMVAL